MKGEHRGKQREEHEEEGDTYEKMKWMAWNINGWKGDQNDKDEEYNYRKIKRIRGEAEKYDGFILTETHLNDDEEKNEIEKFEKHFKDYYVYHVHAREKAGKRLGVTIGIKRNRIEEKDIKIEREEEGEKGRWINMTMKGVLEEDLHVCGVYAPAGTAAKKNVD